MPTEAPRLTLRLCFLPPRGRHASSRRHARLPKPQMQLLATRDATSGFLTVMVTRCWHDWISLPVPKPVMTGREWVRCGPSPTPPFPDPTKQSPQRADCVTLVARVGVDHLRRDLGRRAGGGGEPLVHRGMDSPTLRSKSRARHRGARGRIKCGGRMVDGVWLPRWTRMLPAGGVPGGDCGGTLADGGGGDTSTSWWQLQRTLWRLRRRRGGGDTGRTHPEAAQRAAATRTAATETAAAGGAGGGGGAVDGDGGKGARDSTLCHSVAHLGFSVSHPPTAMERTGGGVKGGSRTLP